MRWLNRDPIGEDGGNNLYLFTGNGPCVNVDFKGLAWKIKRNGEIFATAVPLSDDDNFTSLARILHLDVSDYKKWAHTTDATAIRCKPYRIPNLIVYDNGHRKFIDRMPFNVISVWRSQNERSAQKDKKAGFQVQINNDVTADQIEHALQTDGLYRYTFTGHGDGMTGINAYPDDEETVSPVVRFTRYGISSLVLKACGSAAIDEYGWHRMKGRVKRNNWEINVAKAGYFIGYEDAVCLLNELFQWTITKGSNYNEAD